MRIALITVFVTILVFILFYNLYKLAVAKGYRRALRKYRKLPYLREAVEVIPQELYMLIVEMEDGEIVEFAALHPEGENYPQSGVKNTLI